MKKVLVTNMSSKGQVVIPHVFRKRLGLIPGTPLAAFTDGATLLLKPVELPEADAFVNLLMESRNAAKVAGLKRSGLGKVIKKVQSVR
ncbi:MAG: AbrB/MazE/SpoVT family DNA-binding domain-containing protein [Sulfuricaulis sp.]